MYGGQIDGDMGVNWDLPYWTGESDDLPSAWASSWPPAPSAMDLDSPFLSDFSAGDALPSFLPPLDEQPLLEFAPFDPDHFHLGLTTHPDRTFSQEHQMASAPLGDPIPTDGAFSEGLLTVPAHLFERGQSKRKLEAVGREDKLPKIPRIDEAVRHDSDTATPQLPPHLFPVLLPGSLPLNPAMPMPYAASVQETGGGRLLISLRVKDRPAELFQQVTSKLTALFAAPSQELAAIEQEYATVCQNFQQGIFPPIPKGMAQMLMPYQWRGYRWMETLTRHGIGGCLADEMGLGKTIQAIALIQQVVNDKQTAGQSPQILICCPANLIDNWKRELQVNAPQLYKSTFVHGKGSMHGKSLTLISHQQARLNRNKKEGDPIYFPFTQQWDLIIFDEFHSFLGSQISQQVVRQLRQLCNGAGRGFFGLTGTPMPNNLIELYGLNDLLNPGIYPPLVDFKSSFLRDSRSRLKELLSVVNNSGGKIPDGYSYRELEKNTRWLIDMLIKPFLLRRVKCDSEVHEQTGVMQALRGTLETLPPLEDEIRVSYPFTDLQQSFIAHMQARGSSDDEIAATAGAMSLFANSTKVDEGGMAMRDFACLQMVASHPSILACSEKLMQYIETIQPAFAQAFKSMRIDYEEPGKLRAISDLVRSILDQHPEDKIVIFTNYTQMGQLICDALKITVKTPTMHKVQFLYGELTKLRRTKIIGEFREEKGPPVLVVGRKLGNVGWNCTEANHVIFAESWWNPNDDDQCVGRCHRFRQKKRVHTYRLHQPHFTGDEKLAKFCREKRSWCDLILCGETDNLSERIREIVEWPTQ